MDNSSQASAGSDASVTDYPVTLTFAGLVLGALALLVLLRYLHGSIRVEGGTR